MRLSDRAQLARVDQFAEPVEGQDQVEVLLKARAVVIAGMMALDQILVVGPKQR